MVLKICPKRLYLQGDEFPKHNVKISSFWMDTHEVTNADFQEFVDATGYITRRTSCGLKNNYHLIQLNLLRKVYNLPL
jgi:formylglycine-generating enzyme required for sulfatase activity